MPVASYNQRNHSKNASTTRSLDERQGGIAPPCSYFKAAGCARSRLRSLLVLLVGLQREGGVGHAVFLLELDDASRPVPIDDNVGHELVEFFLAELDCEAPRVLENRLERHLVVLPLRLEQRCKDQCVVVGKGYAVVALQRREHLGGALEREVLHAVVLLQLLVVPRTLDDADLLALELRPILELGRFRRERVHAGRVIAGLDDVHDLAPIGLVVHRRDHQVDLALFEELHPVRRHDGHELQLDAKLVGDVLCEIRFDADDLPAWVAESIGLVIGLDPDDQRPSLLDLLECILSDGRERYRRDCNGRDESRDVAQLEHWTSPWSLKVRGRMYYGVLSVKARIAESAP